MMKGLMEYLICPVCGGELFLTELEYNGSVIEEGILHCGSCKIEYPIIKGIPRLLPTELLPKLVSGYEAFLKKHNLARLDEIQFTAYDTDERIAKGFEFEWKKHSKILSEHEEEFLHVLGDVIAPASLKGKVVLDAGCGQGRFTYFSHKYGAHTIIAFDLGEQVLLASRNLRPYENIHVVQASIYKPPFRSVFDQIFSIGVIHHLPQPEDAFRILYNLLKERGSLFIWVYGYSSIIPVIKFLRKFTLNRSVNFNWMAALVFAVPLYFINQFYNLLNKDKRLRRLADLVPFHMYHDRGFSNVWTICFDKINSGIAVYYRRRDLEGWLERLGDKFGHQKVSVLSERYAGKSGSSWRLMVGK